MAPMTDTPKQQEKPANLTKHPEVAMTSQGLMPRDMDQAWRYATALSKSSFVPQQYADKPGDCLIAIDISMRLGVHPLAFLQNSYVVHGRPGMEAKLVISLINHSGLFTDPLDYEVVGDNPFDKSYQVRAFATRKSTGKVLYGPWITWKLVVGEGWDKKTGSKWQTMPEVMFHYRAASWFANKHCPEIKCGMETTDELADIGDRKQVESKTLEPTNGRVAFGFGNGNGTTELPPTESVPGAGEAENAGNGAPAPASEEPPEPGSTEAFDQPVTQEDVQQATAQADPEEMQARCLKCNHQVPQTAAEMKGKPCPSCGGKLGWKDL